MDYLAGERGQKRVDRAYSRTLRAEAQSEKIQLMELSQAAKGEAFSAQNLTANILENIADAFFALDSEHRFTYLSSQAEQLFLTTKEELIGKCIWDEFPETVGSTFYQEYQSAEAFQVSVQFEEFYLPLETWFEVRVYPDRDGMSVYFRDITARKQTEAELMERSRLSILEAEVGAALVRGGFASASLNRCTEAIVKHLDATFAGIWTFDQRTNLLELQAYTGQPSRGSWVTGENLFAGQHLPLEGCLIGFVAQLRQPYLTQDSNKRSHGGLECRLYNGQVAESCVLISDSYFAGYPLIVENRLIGIIAVVKCQPFSEAAYEMLGWVAQGIALAIDRFWAKEALMTRNAVKNSPSRYNAG